ncbi:MAG TPA: kinase [Candidatus Woesearchaeota archaeon]|nr:kinase [Candidatus Woesearchaeota archaeon]
MLIAITGTPGVGKKTVSKELTRILNLTELDLKDIARKEKILKGYDLNSKSLVVDDSKIGAKIKKYVKKGNNYVVASHISQFISPRSVKLMVVLRVNPDKIEKRLKKRGYDLKKVYDNSMCEYLDSCLIESIQQGHKNHLHEIDATKKSAKKIAREIKDVIENKKKKSFGEVSWVKR